MTSLLQRALAVLAVLVLAGVGAVLLLRDEPPARLAPGSGEPPGGGDLVDPLAYAPARERDLAAAAARGHAHVLYAKSPDGVLASAARTAAHRPLVDSAAATARIEPETLEAMVLLESAGRPDAVADPRLEGAVGLTQILAETGRNLLQMRVDPPAARAIGRSIQRAERRGDGALVRRLVKRRRRVDERFDPARALAATARYLLIAREALQREDLAVVSYHMGIGNLQSALRAFGEQDVSYARLYFDSTPLRHSQAWAALARLGDDSSTYLWRVAAAREIMRLYRSDPQQLELVSKRQNAKASAEEVLHPADVTERFQTPRQLREAYDDGRLLALDRRLLARHGLRVDEAMGELAGRLQRSPATYRGLRPAALALLVYLGAGTKEISGVEPLVLTSSVRDRRYQQLLVAGNREATPNYSLHTTGWAFDILRSYRSGAQARALEFMLGRLQSHDLIAWVREPAAIHVTAGDGAQALLALLDG